MAAHDDPRHRAAARTGAHRRAQSRARALAYGRARSKRRLEAGRFAPWPGWRNLIPAELVVLVDQPTALARVAELVDAEDWRADKRAAWSTMLEVLVQGMDWETGVIAGVTRAQLAERAGVSPRTATSLLGWARGVGLLVMVETGASAAFLGTEKNRAASFVLTVSREWRAPVELLPVDLPVDESCHPPVTHVGQESPRRDRGFQDRQDEKQGTARRSWPVFDAPTSTADRAAAADVFLDRAGIAGKVVRWRAIAMLTRWFRAGWSPMALLHAVDHHPDGGQSRGDAVRSARDPLAVIGFRLRAWDGQLAALPVDLRPGARKATVAPIVGRAERAAARLAGETAGAEARADIRRHLASRRNSR